MKNKKYYLLIISYVLLVVLILLGVNHLYGSTTDWISQHSVLPEYFRNMFYETGRLVPNFSFNLGAGQNIYNYSYYGLLSPVILISYLLPFIKMTTYIQIASIVLYILFGILTFKFINHNFKDEKLSFITSIIGISTISINYNFHHHIMFVWYLPFLVLGLIGVDRYIEKKKSDLVILSSFLIIMTNYYYSVGSLLVIFLYGVFKILDRLKFKLKESIFSVFKFGLHLVVSVLMSMIILLPTLLCIRGGSRGHVDVDITSLLIPDFKELFYNPVGLGIGCIFLVCLFFNIFRKKSDKSKLFLNISLLIVLLLPVISYFLNGLLYARGKVLIPFIPLFLYCFCMFYKDFIKSKFNYKYLIITAIILMAIYSLFNYSNFIFIIDIGLCLLFIFISIKRKNRYYLLGYLCVVSIVSLFIVNQKEEYIKLDYYKKVNNPGIVKLYKNIDDESVYRSYNDLIPKVDINKSYSSNYYGVGIYSSTYNKDYWDFYNFNFGNNMKYRNVLITSGTDNDLFYTFMGVKYITSPNKNSLYYEKIDSSNGINLYENIDSYPLMYIPNSLGNIDEINSLDFPYNIEGFMNKSYVDNYSGTNNYETKIIKDLVNVEDEYNYSFKKTNKIHYDLDSKYNGKILYLKFKMNKNKKCVNGAGDDLSITINGVKNKLTCGGYIYHNQNNIFEYVIPITDSSLGVDVSFTKGDYNISDIEVYYSDKLGVKNREADNIKINKKNDSITGNINLEDDNYLITSIPYDEGFSVFVNGEKKVYEKVNKAFLGFKLKKGNNKIVIKYNSPGYRISKIISFIGLILYIFILYFENKGLNTKKKGE